MLGVDLESAWDASGSPAKLPQEDTSSTANAAHD